MLCREILVETPASDRAMRNLARRTAKQVVQSTDPLQFGVIRQTKPQTGFDHFFPIAYLPTPFPDLVVALMADHGSPCLVQLRQPNNSSNLPPEIAYVMAFPMRRAYRYPEDASFAVMTQIASQWMNEPILLRAKVESDIATFVHEFVHYQDFSKAKMVIKPSPSVKTRGPDAYYNSALERNAYFHEALHVLDKRPKAFFAIPFAKFVQKAFKLFAEDFIKYIDADSRKRLISRLYSVWTEKN